MDTSTRIGIVGAGAAGLAAAEALARAGYRSVTVLEKADRVGGKCRSFEVDGRVYELGAGALTRRYDNVLELARRHGLSPSPGASGLFIDLETGRRSFIPPDVTIGSSLRLGVESARLFAGLRSERRLARPGFDGISRELRVPLAEWAKRRGVEGAMRLIEPWFTGFGYGYADEIPAAYALKYALLFSLPIYELLDVGYQGLWERVARDLDVKLGAEVMSIDRSGRGGAPVAVETSAGRFDFDALIVACPLEQLVDRMDASAEERRMFAAIRYNDYHVVAVRMDGAPEARYGFFSRHLDRAHAGEAVFFYRRFLAGDVVLFYTMPEEGGSLDQSVATVHRTIDRLGGKVREDILSHAWRYFPHVSTEEMQGGYYERLEALQGRQRTWIAGEICAFTAVESVVAYSRELVRRFFT